MVKITDYNDANLETISVTYFWGSCHSADCQHNSIPVHVIVCVLNIVVLRHFWKYKTTINVHKIIKLTFQDIADYYYNHKQHNDPHHPLQNSIKPSAKTELIPDVFPRSPCKAYSEKSSSGRARRYDPLTDPTMLCGFSSTLIAIYLMGHQSMGL